MSQANSARASPAPAQGQGQTYQFAYPYSAASGTSSTYYQYPTNYWYPYGSYTQHSQQQQQRPATATGSSTPQPQQRQFNYYNNPGTSTSTAAGKSTAASKKPSYLKGLFHKDLRNLMYGFGDDRNPANDSVNVLEEILIEYITDVCTTAMGTTRKPRLGIEDLRKALSRPADAKKLARMEELLFMQEDIKRARAMVPNDRNMQDGSF